MEEELISLLKTHEQHALRKIFNLYHQQLCSLAYSLIRDEDLAKDIVQDVFIKLWNNRLKIEISTSLNAYLKKATVNTALNYIESHSRIKKEPIERDLPFYSQSLTDNNISGEELRQRAEHSIKKLPPRTRTVFTLIRFEDMSYKEVAEALGISGKAVEKEMMKALSLLRIALKDYLPAALVAMMTHTL